jgi:hypothetical protein
MWIGAEMSGTGRQEVMLLTLARLLFRFDLLSQLRRAVDPQGNKGATLSSS